MWLWVAENFSRVTDNTRLMEELECWGVALRQDTKRCEHSSESTMSATRGCEHTFEFYLYPLLPLPTVNSSGARAVSQASDWQARRRGSEMKELSTGSSRTLRREQLGISARNTKIRSSFKRIQPSPDML